MQARVVHRNERNPLSQRGFNDEWDREEGSARSRAARQFLGERLGATVVELDELLAAGLGVAHTPSSANDRA